jgi:hypothetical protein
VLQWSKLAVLYLEADQLNGTTQFNEMKGLADVDLDSNIWTVIS